VGYPVPPLAVQAERQPGLARTLCATEPSGCLASGTSATAPNYCLMCCAAAGRSRGICRRLDGNYDWQSSLRRRATAALG